MYNLPLSIKISTIELDDLTCNQCGVMKPSKNVLNVLFDVFCINYDRFAKVLFAILTQSKLIRTMTQLTAYRHAKSHKTHKKLV